MPSRKPAGKSAPAKAIQWPKLFASFIACFAAAGFGSFFTASAIPTWYAALSKPFFAPPNWLFGPAWTLLYILMAVSLYLVWSKGFSKNRKPIFLFAIQLFLNALWSLAFFGLRNPAAGFAVIVLLWISIVATMLAFKKADKKAAWLLVPYILWVSFASVLNFAVMLLNP